MSQFWRFLERIDLGLKSFSSRPRTNGNVKTVILEVHMAERVEKLVSLQHNHL
jgi:hypothetical protein